MIDPLYFTTESPMQVARIRTALERQHRVNGQHEFRWQTAERFARLPYLVFDETKRRLYVSPETFFAEKDLTKTLVEYALWLHATGPA